MGHQLGLGWGKGRRVIVTVRSEDAVTRALKYRQQRWTDRSVVVDDRQVQTGRDLFDALQRIAGARRQPLHLRMAKAGLRSRTP